MARSQSDTRTAPAKANKVPPSPEELGLDEVDAASAASMDASDPPAFGGVTGVGPAEDIDGNRVDRIRLRAHELWQEAGCPAGGADLDFWLAAEAEIDGASAEQGNGG